MTCPFCDHKVRWWQPKRPTFRAGTAHRRCFQRWLVSPLPGRDQ